tara:strand:- start:6 stop:590 length:585 start_codon:yes stop_codon:yes gene_type:complete
LYVTIPPATIAVAKSTRFSLEVVDAEDTRVDVLSIVFGFSSSSSGSTAAPRTPSSAFSVPSKVVVVVVVVASTTSGALLSTTTDDLNVLFFPDDDDDAFLDKLLPFNVKVVFDTTRSDERLLRWVKAQKPLLRRTPTKPEERVFFVDTSAKRIDENETISSLFFSLLVCGARAIVYAFQSIIRKAGLVSLSMIP